MKTKKKRSNIEPMDSIGSVYMGPGLTRARLRTGHKYSATVPVDPRVVTMYLCTGCALKLGGRWPRGHCATCHSAKCPLCGQKKTLACSNDWLWGKDKELPCWD